METAFRTIVPQDRLQVGILAVDLFVETGLAESKSAARRLIKQGAASLNGTRLNDSKVLVSNIDLQDNCITLKIGGKRSHYVVVS